MRKRNWGATLVYYPANPTKSKLFLVRVFVFSQALDSDFFTALIDDLVSEEVDILGISGRFICVCNACVFM